MDQLDARRNNPGGRREAGMKPLSYGKYDREKDDTWEPTWSGRRRIMKPVPVLAPGTRCQVSAWGKWTDAEADIEPGLFWLPSFKVHVEPPNGGMVRV